MIDFALTIDAGHGGKDPGASCNGVVEKDVNFSVASKLCDLLAPQLRLVSPTRVRDEFVPLQERTIIANRHDSWLLSIHCNAQLVLPGKKIVRGCEAHIYSPDAPQALELAEALLVAVARTGIPYSPRKTRLRSCWALRGRWALGTVLSPHLYVLQKTRRPAVLLELGYVTSKEDAKLLGSAEWQGKVAEELARSIVGYLT